MQYGFLIDHERCIGCHACTVACKSENDVPIGSFRTWVKYTEQGTFPDVKRYFAVLRCNQCTSAPCVTICPVNALEKRADGIVDIDRDACIGCRACMQACPYDALYLNEDLGAVEKCHFCAHRIERGLEPACAVVCPENAIIAGDLHDSESTISQLIRENDTLVRGPEQKTGPNVHYLGALKEALEPGSAEEPETFLWSDKPARRPESWPPTLSTSPDTRTVLDVEHTIEWGWPVAAYLVTKGIAGGVAMLAPFTSMFGMEGFAARFLPEIIALLFIGFTGFLLVEDLKKPLVFLRIFTQPNWDSWLVKGAWVINAFVGVVTATLLLRLLGFDGAADVLRWVGAIAGIGVAGYTAFLFAQCKGRDLWESPLLLPHLIVQALLCGSAVLLVMSSAPWSLRSIFLAAALLHALFMIVEWKRSHDTANARQAAAFLVSLRWGPINLFRESILIGVVLAGALAIVSPPLVLIPAVGGLFLYEHAFVRAGQLPPLS